MKVVVSGSSSGLGKAIAEHLKACGQQVYGLSRSQGTDVRFPHWMKVRAGEIGPVDALICCAGIMEGERDEILLTNVNGTWNCIQAFPAKRIICFAGGGAPHPFPGHAAYNVSKTAVISLVANYAAENPQCSINAISPGAHQTAMSATGEADPARLLKMVDWLLTQDKITGRCLSLKHDDWEDEGWRYGVAKNPQLCTIRRFAPSGAPNE